MNTTSALSLRQRLKLMLPCLLYLICGLGCLLVPARFADAFILTAGMVSLLSSIPFFVHAFQWHRRLDLVAALLTAALGLLCVFMRCQGAFLIGVLYSVYLLAIGLVFLIQAVLDRFSGSRLWIGLGYLLAGGLLLAFRHDDPRFVMEIIGAYLLLQAWQNLEELFCFSNPYDAKYWSMRHWMALPAFFIGIFPSFVIGRIQDEGMKHRAVDFDGRKNDSEVNLRIWIHTGTYGPRLYGHMTFSRNNVMYSYGDYDVPAEKLFGTIGPGIFFTVNAEIYANNCCIVEHSPLFEYGLHLTDAQLQAFDRMSGGIFAQTVPWVCPMEAAHEAGRPVSLQTCGKMYANRLWFRTGCRFRMYTRGPWKWYALLGNNCSNFAAAKLNEIGLHLPVSHGVVSPGEFYEVMETLFDDPDSCVITRSYHTVDIPASLFDVPD
ncbi:hypothetical protein [Faecalibaculum rodentium]|uniref:hypothetical protein n=1 Tax=Faecalibaculum rodentium TaxID=1702221 RepID=UPI0025B77873|nr:hypothetical protein [Faecalibaculum rodentium]